jgi:LysM repeat protein
MSTINGIDGGVRITGVDNSRNPFKLAGPGKDPDYLLDIDYYLEELLDEHQITVVLGDKTFEPGEDNEIEQKEIKKALEPLPEEERNTIPRIMKYLCWLLRGFRLAEDFPYDIEKVRKALKRKTIDFVKLAESPSVGYSYDSLIAGLVELGVISAAEIAKNTVEEASTKVVASDEGAPVAEETESITPAESVETSPNYTVKKGDTLWAIAERELGDGNKWRKIYDANQESIDQIAVERFKGKKTSGLEEKSGQTIVWIFEGQNLIIPQVEVEEIEWEEEEAVETGEEKRIEDEGGDEELEDIENDTDGDEEVPGEIDEDEVYGEG